jgi:hypothetical protein
VIGACQNNVKPSFERIISMGTAYYLQIPDLPGDSKEPHHVGWHTIKSYGVPDPSGQPSQGNKRRFRFLFASLPDRKIGKELVDAVREHKRFEKVVFYAWNDAENYQMMTLFGAVIDDIYFNKSGSAGEEKEENIVISFKSMSGQDRVGLLKQRPKPEEWNNAGWSGLRTW